ncbi:MAG: MBL fold metallo-hydrolase [Actinobacteria bacterium]|nr:MAG: MBL fold metallo-hydrolase [Actinomycetota bacterium]
MIEPALAGDAFLRDVETAPAGALHLWWLGQSGFLVRWESRHLLLDPYLSDSLTRKYEGTETPHVRMTRLVVDPARLRFVDVVTSSHGHTDHLDAETLRAIRPRALVCPAGIRELALYHSGDTLAFRGLGESLRPFGPDVAILPINGKLGNMGGADAAHVASEAGARVAVPCHFDMFELNTASPDEFVRECERLGQASRVLRAGERLTLPGKGRNLRG